MTTDEIQQLVEEIQQAMTTPEDLPEEELIDLAARHDEFVQQVGGRLRSVEELLDKGRREEAIALAEQNPNLNDLVTALDFPEFDAWNDYLLQFGIQAVHELPVDIASDLNDAYSVSVPLERLLQRYRTQSLARAPIPERIETLRQLAVEDTSNTRWGQDVLKFETHRVGELKKELQTAVKERDLNRVADLDRELSGQWQVKIPAGLKKNAREAHVHLRKRDARNELEPLCHQLSDAYADFDRPAASRLQKRFFALSEILDLTETDPLYDIAGPALDWLSEEEAREAATADFEGGKAELEAALERETTIEELERLYHQTVRHGDTLPELLENRLADRIENLKSAASRKRIVVMSSIVSGCLIAIVMVVLIIQRVTFNATVAGHVEQVDRLLTAGESSGDLESVDDYFSKIESDDPRFLAHPDLLGLHKKLESVRSVESGRRQQLEGLISSGLQLGTESPRWENFAEAEKTLEEASELARNDAEKARVVNAKSQVQRVRSDLQLEVDTAFEADQQELVQGIEGLPNDSLALYPEIEKRLVELDTRQHVSPELKTALAALSSKVQRQKSMVQTNLDVARSLQGITSSAGRPIEFRKALVEHTRRHPGTERAEDLLEVVKTDLPLWEGVDQWNDIRRKLQRTSLGGISPADAAGLISTYDTFQKTSGPYPGEMKVESRISALKAIAAREEGESGSSADQITRMLAPRTISEAYLVTTKDDKDDLRYFAEDVPEVTGSAVQFQYFTTTTGTQRESKSLALLKVPGCRTRKDDDWRAPQTVLASNLRNIMMEDLDRNFAEAIRKGVEATVAHPELDEILRLLLVERMLKIGSEGNLFIQQRMETYLTAINASGVSRLTNWAAPEDSRANTERRKAAEFCKQFGPQIVKDLTTVEDDTQAAMREPIGPEMKCVGWLHLNVEGQWVIALTKELKLDQPTPLMALGYRSATTPEFYPVAELSGDVLGTVAAASTLSDAKEGHPVYREAFTN